MEHPTDVPIEGVYSSLEQTDFGTENIFKNCPSTSKIVTDGGASEG